jgi:hypothetical protein
MPFVSPAKVGRNDRCPCGSGKKYKQCCLNSQPVSTDSAWKRQRDASDRLTGELLRFCQREFPDDRALAWMEFNQTPVPPPLDTPEAEAELQIFSPWFLFTWDPELSLSDRDSQPVPGMILHAFLHRSADRLSGLEHLLLEQAYTQPVSFYEVLDSVPGERVVLRDILIGGDTEVTERSASRFLRPGDLCYGQIWRLPGVNTLGRLAPCVIPAGKKVDIIGLRVKLKKKIAKKARELEAQDLLRYEHDVRRVYLDLRDTMRLPPRLVNTDGDPILFHTLTFQVESPQVAFAALAPMAWETTKEELLEAAELDGNGSPVRFEIEWAKKGNKMHKTWDNTILGHLKVDGRTLVAEVNSQKRAETLRREVERRMGTLAVHVKTVQQTPEEMLKNKPKALKAAAESEPPPIDPEERAELEAYMRQEVEAWIHKKVPALGGRTPLAAVRDPDGREMVEALLLDWERKTKNERGSTQFIQPDIGAVRRLLKL